MAKPKKPVKEKASPKPKSKPKKKPPARKQPSKKTQSKKPAPAGDQLGKVIAFFRIPVVAVIKVARGSLRVGDSIWIKGHTTDLKQTVSSIQIDHQPVQEVRKRGEAGVKVSGRVRRGDRVYRI